MVAGNGYVELGAQVTTGRRQESFYYCVCVGKEDIFLELPAGPNTEMEQKLRRKSGRSSVAVLFMVGIISLKRKINSINTR